MKTYIVHTATSLSLVGSEIILKNKDIFEQGKEYIFIKKNGVKKLFIADRVSYNNDDNITLQNSNITLKLKLKLVE